VFISIPRGFTWARPRACGGLAIMIMQPVNLGAGVPGIRGIGGLPVITGTKNAPLPAALVSRGQRIAFRPRRPN
jgi:hypothetical protein